MYRHCIAAIHVKKNRTIPYIKLLMYRDVSFPNMEIRSSILKQGARAHVQSCRALIQGHVAYRWAQPNCRRVGALPNAHRDRRYLQHADCCAAVRACSAAARAVASSTPLGSFCTRTRLPAHGWLSVGSGVATTATASAAAASAAAVTLGASPAPSRRATRRVRSLYPAHTYASVARFSSCPSCITFCVR